MIATKLKMSSVLKYPTKTVVQSPPIPNSTNFSFGSLSMSKLHCQISKIMSSGFCFYIRCPKKDETRTN